MADKLISDLGAAAALAGTDLFETEQGGSISTKATLAAVKTFVRKDVVTALTISAGVITLDLSLGKSFTVSLTANVTSVVISNLPGAGFAAEYDLEIKQDATGGRTFAIPASHKALGGSDVAIASAANAVTLLTAKSFDNGTTYRYAMQESA